ncbi:MAG TPA: hypothetical protein VFC50_03775 [Candidatus Dormibacteraeota bacterium]|nr:hypothetical protein [Candidatus Dormibacteraeota bacterium]
MIKQLDKWHKTKSGLLVFFLVELLIAYGFASLAINRGNLWYYLLTLVFLVGSLQNFFKLIGTIFHHGKR